MNWSDGRLSWTTRRCKGCGAVLVFRHRSVPGRPWWDDERLSECACGPRSAVLFADHVPRWCLAQLGEAEA